MARERNQPNTREGVLICGAYGHGNAGDEAILLAIINSLRSIDPKLPITVLSRTPEKTAERFGVKALYTFDFLGFQRAMRSCALFLDGGGSLIQDVTSRRSLWYYLYTIRAAKKRKCRVLMYGCGIGPVNFPSDVALVRRVLNRYVDVITLREEHSLKELQRFGVTAPEIVVSSDPALALFPADDERVDGLMAENGLDPKGRYVCFSVRKWDGIDRKAKVFAAAADHCSALGAIPLFVHINRPEDAAATSLVRSLMKTPSFLVDELPDASLTIGLMSRMAAVVSMRLHGLIFAASTGTPVVGVSYDPKVTAFLDSVDEQLCVPFDEVTAERLCDLVEQAVARGTDSQARRQTMERLKAAEKTNLAYAKKLLDK